MSRHYYDRSSRFDDSTSSDLLNSSVDLDNVNEVAAEKEAEEKPALSFETAGKINKYSNLRKAPNTDCEVLAKMNANSEVVVLDSKKITNGFYKVRYNDIVGYVRKDLCDIKD